MRNIKSKMSSIIAIIVMLLFVDIVVSAAIYYVAIGVSDANLGTEASPWKTIQKAADTLVAGDIVYIKAGTYPCEVLPASSGTDGKEL